MHDSPPAHAAILSDEYDVPCDQAPSFSRGYRITGHAAEHQSDPPEGTERIVLAEDDPNLRKSIQVVLRELGYQVQAFASGRDVLAALSVDERPIELLLTDFELPGLTGYELAGRLRTLRPNIKVLLTSGMSEDNIAPTVKPADWPPFIRKPFNLNSLGHKLREILEEPSASP